MTSARRLPRSHCSILPSYLLRAIARNGSARQRDVALETLARDSTFRALRASAAGSPATWAGERTPQVRKQRRVHDAEGASALPGRLVRGEGEPPTGDAAVDEAFDGLGATFDFYFECCGRNSIDDEGLPLDATVHYGSGYDNAFWDGRRMVFGDGDGELFNRFTICLDIIGHELTHGVTDDEAQLVYLFQPGALNESISDVFGSLVKQKAAGQRAAEADWLIGNGLFTPNVKGVALRSMKEPGTAYDDAVLGRDPQPGHLRDYVRTHDDNGGVHINSGIPNRAFYLAATALGGFAWERAGLIWYEALRHPKLRKNAGLRSFAKLTLSAADRLHGVASPERELVRGAWEQVGFDELA